MATVSPSEVARVVLGLVRSRPATLGAGRLICVDGPAGSGKTTLGRAISDLAQAPLIHMDDLYDGWGGLPRLADQLDSILAPLARGEAGSYRRYDWEAGRYDETVAVVPAPLLVLEGVGSGSRVTDGLATVLVWVEAPADLRVRRGLERDGEQVEHHWRQWTLDEAEHFDREGTAGRADLLVDGTGGREPLLARPTTPREKFFDVSENQNRSRRVT